MSECLPKIAFSYGEIAVPFNENRHVNLTVMWQAAGSPANRDPRKWRTKVGRGFIADLARSLNVPVGDVIRGTRGKGGATWSHWQIAVAYAKHLSHEFHRHVNEAFREWAEEAENPSLKIDRAIKIYRRRGHEDSWIGTRLDGKIQRLSLTSTLRAHNCLRSGSDSAYARVSRSVMLSATGSTPSEYRQAHGLPASKPVRDHLDRLTLAKLNLLEAEVESEIKASAADGEDACSEVGAMIGRRYREIFKISRN